MSCGSSRCSAWRQPLRGIEPTRSWMCSGRARRRGNTESRLRGGGVLSYSFLLQEPPGSTLEGLDVLDIDEAPPELDGSLVLQASESPRHRLPIGPYHGAKVLVGVAGRYPDLPGDLHPLALDEEEDEAR